MTDAYLYFERSALCDTTLCDVVHDTVIVDKAHPSASENINLTIDLISCYFYILILVIFIFDSSIMNRLHYQRTKFVIISNKNINKC